MRTNFSVPHTATQPVIPDVTMPTIIGTTRSSGMPSLIRPPSFTNTAPAVTGIAIRKLMRAAASRSNRRKRPAVIVMPEREVPGLRASAWAAPITTASRSAHAVDAPVAHLAGRRPTCSMPNTISEMPMIVGLPRCSSICSWNTAPTRAAGIVASSSSHATLPSVVTPSRRWKTARQPSRMYTARSLRK